MRPATSRAGRCASGHVSGSFLRVLQQGEDGLDGEAVAGAPEAGDGAGGDGGDHRGVPPRLAGGGVGEVDLDDDSIVGGEGVGQGVGIVGESARVEDDRRRPAPGVVDGVDQVALVVRLQVLDLVAAEQRRLPGRLRRGRRGSPCRRSRVRASRGGSGSARSARGSASADITRDPRVSVGGVTPKPTMMAGSSSAEPRARLPMTTTTTSPVRPAITPATKATTARPKNDQPACRARAASRATSSRRCRTGSGSTVTGLSSCRAAAAIPCPGGGGRARRGRSRTRPGRAGA